MTAQHDSWGGDITCPNADNHRHGDAVFVCDGCGTVIGCGWDVLVDDNGTRMGYKCCYNPKKHEFLSGGSRVARTGPGGR